MCENSFFLYKKLNTPISKIIVDYSASETKFTCFLIIVYFMHKNGTEYSHFKHYSSIIVLGYSTLETKYTCLMQENSLLHA